MASAVANLHNFRCTAIAEDGAADGSGTPLGHPPGALYQDSGALYESANRGALYQVKDATYLDMPQQATMKARVPPGSDDASWQSLSEGVDGPAWYAGPPGPARDLPRGTAHRAPRGMGWRPQAPSGENRGGSSCDLTSEEESEAFWYTSGVPGAALGPTHSKRWEQSGNRVGLQGQGQGYKDTDVGGPSYSDTGRPGYSGMGGPGYTGKHKYRETRGPGNSEVGRRECSDMGGDGYRDSMAYEGGDMAVSGSGRGRGRGKGRGKRRRLPGRDTSLLPEEDSNPTHLDFSRTVTGPPCTVTLSRDTMTSQCPYCELPLALGCLSSQSVRVDAAGGVSVEGVPQACLHHLCSSRDSRCERLKYCYDVLLLSGH